MNPFLTMANPEPWGPGSFQMALPLMLATGIRPGMRVLEVGGGSGQVAATVAKHFDVTVVTLEPWTDGQAISAYAAAQGVSNQVLPMRTPAQSIPFPDGSFDAVISIGAFEMIGDERPQALQEIKRVLRHGARFGIAEPMSAGAMPADLAALDAEYDLKFQECFRTLDWNRDLFTAGGLFVVQAEYFAEAYEWWLDYRAQGKISAQEQDFIMKDQGRWISLGMLVGEKNM